MKFIQILKKHTILTFFILTFLISGGISIPLILSLHGIITIQLPGILGFVAASGSSISALILISILYGKNGWKSLFNKFKFNFNYKWYLFILLNTCIFIFIAVWLPTLFGKLATPFFQNIPMLIPMLIILTIQAGLGEEIGWRGFVTPKMQKKFSGLTTCLIISIIWSIWHIALYFVPNSFQWQMWNQFGFLITFIGYSVHLLAITIIYTWSYNMTKSLMLPIFLHGFMNGFAWFFGFTEIKILGYRPFLILIGFEIIVVFLIIKHSGKDLRWSEDSEII